MQIPREAFENDDQYKRYLNVQAAHKKELARMLNDALTASGAEQIERASAYFLRLNSEERLDGLLEILPSTQEPHVFWRIFLDTWPMCDASDPVGLGLLQGLLEGAGSAVPYYSDADRAFYNSLPKVVRVYRGGSRRGDHVSDGISWTTDKKVAEGFARGHRGITVPEPAIAYGRVPKHDILCVLTERKESEVLSGVVEVTQVRSFRP